MTIDKLQVFCPRCSSCLRIPRRDPQNIWGCPVCSAKFIVRPKPQHEVGVQALSSGTTCSEGYPSSSKFVHAKRESPENRAVSLAGITFSILGWLTCGLLSPIGFCLSLFSLVFYRPRKIAAIGLLLSIPGLVPWFRTITKSSEETIEHRLQLGQPFFVGDARLTFRAVETGNLLIYSVRQGTVFSSSEPLLNVFLEIHNHSHSNEVKFQPSYFPPFGTQYLQIKDDKGVPVQQTNLDTGYEVADLNPSFPDYCRLPPQDTVLYRIYFLPPSNEASAVELTLDLTCIGKPGKIRCSVPRDSIRTVNSTLMNARYMSPTDFPRYVPE